MALPLPRGDAAMAIADITNSPEAQVFATSLAAKYGITPAAAQGAIAGLLPSLIGGIEANTMTRGGIADLMAALSSGHHQSVIDNPALIGQPNTIADGNAVIGHILGSSGLPQSALQAAAGQSGVPAGLLREIAPAVAVFLLGWLFRNGGGMLGSVLRSAVGGAGGGGLSMPQMPPMGRPAGGGGMMPPMPDLRNITTGNNPYGDIANTIRTGGALGGGVAGGVRDILGNALGFGTSKGITGWIIRLLVLRYGMTILRAILRSFVRGA